MDWLLDIYHAFRLSHAVWCYIAYGLVAAALLAEGWKVTAVVVGAVGWVAAGGSFTGSDKPMTFGAWVTNFGVIVVLLISTLPCYIPWGVWSAWEWWKEWSSRHSPQQLQAFAKTLGGVTVPHEKGAVALLPCAGETVALAIQCDGVHTWAQVFLPWKGEPPTFVTTEGALRTRDRYIRDAGGNFLRKQENLILFTGDTVDRVDVGLDAACKTMLVGAAVAVPLLAKHPGLERVPLAELAPFLIGEYP